LFYFEKADFSIKHFNVDYYYLELAVYTKSDKE